MPFPFDLRRVVSGSVRACALLFLLTACDQEDKITVENLIQEPPNQPPLIVSQGPELPPEGLDVTYNVPSLYVLVGDPNGLDDISLVTMNVESIQMDRFLIRPSTSSGSCFTFTFAPNETIATQLILPVPHTFPGFEFQPLKKSQGGLYVADPFQIPDMLSVATNVRQMGGGCGEFSAGVLYPWIVMPPVTPSDTIAVVSFVDVHYQGISVTVYDKVGASATTTFPDVHLRFTTQEEKTVLP